MYVCTYIKLQILYSPISFINSHTLQAVSEYMGVRIELQIKPEHCVMYFRQHDCCTCPSKHFLCECNWGTNI